MQLRGWGLTRASRIVIILLVVQHLGLGLIHAFVTAPTAELSLTDHAQAFATLDVVLTLAVPFDASRRSSAVLGEPGSRAIPLDPTPPPSPAAAGAARRLSSAEAGGARVS
jgi:hypothetical protein